MCKPDKMTMLRMPLTALLALLLFASCLEDEADTLVLPLPDGKIPYSVISEELQDSLLANGFIIHEGITPPNIEGIFLAAPMSLHYSSDNYSNEFYPLTMTFRDQKRRGMIVYSERQRDTVEGASLAAQVIGHDSCFTMYCYQNLAEYSEYQPLWSCKIATVISGILSPSGIKDCQYTFIILEKEASNSYYDAQLSEPGTFRIFDDGDGLASRLR